MATYKLLGSAIIGSPISGGHLTIAGAGIAGLLIGYYCKQAGIPFTILEQSDKAGGLIQTHNTGFGYIDSAANGFLWCPEMQAIADTLGLSVLPPGKKAKARYIVRNGRLSRMPLSVGDGFRILGGMLRKHREPFTTVAEFGLHVLGRQATYGLLDPAMGGIYAASIDKLSLPGALPMIARAHQLSDRLLPGLLRYRRLQPATPKAASGTHSFAGGMGALVEALTNHLAGHIQYGVDAFTMITPGDDVVFTTPAYATAAAFPNGEIRQILSSVPYTPVISVKLVFEKKDLPAAMPSGFGALLPRSEGMQLLGVLFNHDIFPQNTHEGYASFTCIFKEDPFAADLQYFHRSEQELTEMVLREFRELFPGAGNPVHSYVDRWRKGIPLYTPQHYANLLVLEEQLPRLFPHWRLFSNYTGQISVRGMAQEAAKIAQQ